MDRFFEIVDGSFKKPRKNPEQIFCFVCRTPKTQGFYVDSGDECAFICSDCEEYIHQELQKKLKKD